MSSGDLLAFCLYQYIALCPRCCSHFKDFLFEVPIDRYLGVWIILESMGTVRRKGQKADRTRRKLIIVAKRNKLGVQRQPIGTQDSPAPRRQRTTQ
jgi:hypothetical protein